MKILFITWQWLKKRSKNQFKNQNVQKKYAIRIPVKIINQKSPVPLEIVVFLSFLIFRSLIDRSTL